MDPRNVIVRPVISEKSYALIAEGVNDCEVARRLGLPRTTVRDMRRGKARSDVRTVCPRCWRATSPVRFVAADYAELLGLYLGDGHIAELARTQRLRLSLDSRHEEVVADSDALLCRCFPANRVGRVLGPRGTMVVLHVYHRHLSCRCRLLRQKLQLQLDRQHHRHLRLRSR